MPEGPECAVVSDAINQFCPATFSAAQVVENVPGKIHRYSRSKPDNWNQLQQSWTLRYTRAKGKLILFDIKTADKTWVGLSTLGMSGDWVWGGKKKKHCRLNFVGDGNPDLSFIDMRCFGTFRIMSAKNAKDAIKKIGWNLVRAPMPTSKWKKLQSQTKLRNKPIGVALLEQSSFSGIGNIYKAETLYRAKIHPSTLIRNLSQQQWISINNIAHQIMKQAYEAKGCSVSDFTANGEEGRAQLLLQVYGKHRCPQKHPISTIKQGKGSNCRTTWFCERCL